MQQSEILTGHTFPQFIRPMSLLSYTSKTKTDRVFFLSSNEKEKIGCNGGFCIVLGAECNLSFGKLCKCISKSESGCWKLNLTESFDLIQRNKQTKQFSKDSIENHSRDATVSQLKQNKQCLILQTHSFFHTSVGCCIRR
jgi:hypothetical protein